MEPELEPPYWVVKTGLTEDDFYRLAGEDSDWESLDGKILVRGPAADRHEDLFRFLIALLSNYLEEKGGGVVRGSRYPMRLDPRWSPEPDLLIVRDARRHLMTPQRLEVPADMVIEIASESDPGLVIREKLPRYREAEIEEIWLIDPFKRSVRAETLTPQGYSTQTLDAGRLQSRVVPGFWIEVSWLWQEELRALACMRSILGSPQE